MDNNDINPMAAQMLGVQPSSPTSTPSDTDNTQDTSINPQIAQMLGIAPSASNTDAQNKTAFDKGLGAAPVGTMSISQKMDQNTQNDLPTLRGKTGQQDIGTDTFHSFMGSIAPQPGKDFQGEPQNAYTSDLTTRLEIGGADKFEDKQAIFKRDNPTGDMMQGPSGQTYFRRNNTDDQGNPTPYSVYDESIGKGQIGGIVDSWKSLVYGSAVATDPAIGAYRMLANTALKTTAMVGGIEEGLKASGESTMSQGEIAMSVLKNLGFNEAGASIGRFLTATASGLTGRGFLDIPDNVNDIRKYAAENKLPDAIYPQVTSNPITRKITQLISGLDSHIKEKVQDQAHAVLGNLLDVGGSALKDVKVESAISQQVGLGMSRDEAIKKLGLDAARYTTPVPMPVELNNYFNQYKKDIEDLFIHNPRTTMSDGGRAAESIISQYEKESGDYVNLKFGNVRTAAGQDNITMRPDAAINQAREFKAGIVGAKTPAPAQIDPTTGVTIVPVKIDATVGLSSTNDLPEGHPLKKVVDILNRLNPDMKTMTQQIPTVERDAAGNVIPGTTKDIQVTPWEQLHQIRSDLYSEIFTNRRMNTPLSDREEGQLYSIIGKVSDAIDHPYINGAPAPSGHPLLPALDEANSAAKERFELLKNANTLRVWRGAMNDRLSQVMDSVDNKNSEATLNNLQTMATKIGSTPGLPSGTDLWQTVKDAAVTNLLDKPETIRTRLAQLDQPTRERLFGPGGQELNTKDLTPSPGLYSPSIQDQLVIYGKAMERVQSSGIADKLSRNTSFINSLIDSSSNWLAQSRELAKAGNVTGAAPKNLNQVDELLKFATADPTGKVNESVKAGIIQNLFDRIAEMPPAGKMDIRNTQAATTIGDYVRKLQESGMDKFLSPKEIDQMQNMARYVGLIATQKADVGMSLQAAAIASEATHLEPRALMHIITAKIAGAAFVHEGAMQRFLMGNPSNAKVGEKFSPVMMQIISSLGERALDSGSVPVLSDLWRDTKEGLKEGTEFIQEHTPGLGR